MRLRAGLFTNTTYEKYLILDWERFRDKESYDFENYQKYEKLKEEEIRKSFVFNNIKDIKSFYDTFVYLKSIAKNDWSYNNSFDLIDPEEQEPKAHADQPRQGYSGEGKGVDRHGNGKNGARQLPD